MSDWRRLINQTYQRLCVRRICTHRPAD
uniref:Uncharacterized protein n=1 Tax=Macrostomum lignano TaxID=282301 RepID=A0A1I8F9Y5_9PLAT